MNNQPDRRKPEEQQEKKHNNETELLLALLLTDGVGRESSPYWLSANDLGSHPEEGLAL